MKQLSNYIYEKLVINKDYKDSDDLKKLYSFLQPIYNYDWEYKRTEKTGTGYDTNIKFTNEEDVYETVLKCFKTVSKEYRSTALVKCYVYYNDEQKRICVIFDKQKGKHADDVVDFHVDNFNEYNYNIVFKNMTDTHKFRKNLESINYKHFKMPIAAIINVCDTLKIGYWSNN